MNNKELIAAIGKLPTATIHEAMDRRGNLAAAIKPVGPEMSLAGPAFPLRSPGGNNLMLHKALYEARSGDVIVAYVNDDYDYGYWGEILSEAAISRGIGGLVIDGCVRDLQALIRQGFPVFARGICIRGTGKAPQGTLKTPVSIGDTTVNPGDVIIGDLDGVVAVPAASLEEVFQAAHAREEKESGIIEQIRSGTSTLDIYGFEV